MKKTNLFFFALFIAANVFVGCDSSLYDDVSVSNQSKSMELAVADNGEDAYYWYKGEKHYFLTSSSCHPKVFVKEFCYFLMSCHQHCLGVNLLVQR